MHTNTQEQVEQCRVQGEKTSMAEKEGKKRQGRERRGRQRHGRENSVRESVVTPLQVPRAANG